MGDEEEFIYLHNSLCYHLSKISQTYIRMVMFYVGKNYIVEQGKGIT